MKSIDYKVNQSRKAIAMIELIFALVIIGITLMSVPNLISQAQRSGYVALQQEAIAAASSNINLMLSREWDEQNTDSSIGVYILKTLGDVNLSVRDGGKYRKYSPTASTDNPNASVLLGSDLDDLGINDDIDDLFATGGQKVDGVQDLLDTINTSTTVTYLNDSIKLGDWRSGEVVIYSNPFFLLPVLPLFTTNIKGITVTLTSGSLTPDGNSIPELEKTIVLRAFSCNIGSYELAKRVFY